MKLIRVNSKSRSYRLKKSDSYEDNRTSRGKLTKSDSTASEKSQDKHQTTSQLPVWAFLERTIALYIFTFIGVVLCTAAAFGFYFEIIPTNQLSSKPHILQNCTDKNQSSLWNYCVKMNINCSSDINHVLRNRYSWRSPVPLNYTKKLDHPVSYVIISHTAGFFCKSFSSCAAIVRVIQELHIMSGLPDIGYNFLIGGSGDIFAGTGWFVPNFHMDDSIGISFMGNFETDQLTKAMIDAAIKLMFTGKSLGYLKRNFKVVCHNQTKSTTSPGRNVYRIVSRWPHFYPGRI